eukprot:g1822.t1
MLRNLAALALALVVVTWSVNALKIQEEDDVEDEELRHYISEFVDDLYARGVRIPRDKSGRGLRLIAEEHTEVPDEKHGVLMGAVPLTSRGSGRQKPKKKKKKQQKKKRSRGRATKARRGKATAEIRPGGDGSAGRVLMDMQRVPAGVREAYARELHAGRAAADPAARAQRFEAAAALFDGHAGLHHALGMAYADLARANPLLHVRARNAFRVALHKLTPGEARARTTFAANLAAAVHRVDSGPGHAYLKDALRLCADGGSLPEPCRKVMERAGLGLGEVLLHGHKDL